MKQRGILEQVANAVLYEGYILYPYRPSSLKNRQRWTFGGLCPEAYSNAQKGNERWSCQTECLAVGSGKTTIKIKIRFLHLISRQVARIRRPLWDFSECAGSDFEFVDSLKVGDRLVQTWQEANECEIELPEFVLEENQKSRPQVNFRLPDSASVEPIRGADGRIPGIIIRTQNALDGAARVETELVGESLYKIHLHVANLTTLADAEVVTREQAMMHSLVSSHMSLNIKNGEFVSLLDPPKEYAYAASQCQNVGVYPVLVGEAGDRSTILSSPVILYDYPNIAPESAGDLFEGAEIDEILTLRILTLTDDEKSEMRQCDDRARQILERVESDPEHLARLHGVMHATGETGGVRQ